MDYFIELKVPNDVPALRTDPFSSAERAFAAATRLSLHPGVNSSEIRVYATNGKKAIGIPYETIIESMGDTIKLADGTYSEVGGLVLEELAKRGLR